MGRKNASLRVTCAPQKPTEELRVSAEFLRGLEILPEIWNETAVVRALPVFSTELKTITNSARQEKRD